MKRWDKRLMLDKIHFAKDYLNGRIEFLIEFDVVCGGETHKCRTVLRHKKFTVYHRHDGLSIGDKFQTRNANEVSHWNDPFVFIVDIEAVKGKKNRIPCFVWSQFSKDSDDIGRGFFYQSLVNKRFKVVSVPLSEREIDIRKIGRNTLEVSNQIASKNVERGPHVMQGIPDNHRNFFRNLFSNSSGPSLLPRIHARIDDNGIRFGIQEISDVFIQFRDVFVGSFDL